MPDSPDGCLIGWFHRLFGRRGAVNAAPPVLVPQAAPAPPRVIVNKRFVSAAEADFFRVLRTVVGSRGHVLAQVSLGRLLWFPPKQPRGPLQTWRNKVGQKTVDFVICDPSTLAPRVAIELNEPSHEAPARVVRDREVAEILHAAGLHLETIMTARMYDTRELEARLGRYL